MSARALLFAYDFPPMDGGIARALGEIARHAGDRIPVSTGPAPAGDAGLAGAVVDRLDMPASRLRTLPGLLRWARRGNGLVGQHRPEFLWAGNLKPAGHVARWLGRRHGMPYGVIVYGGDLLRLRQQVGRSRVKRLVARRLLGDARRVVAISAWTREQLLRLAEPLALPGLAARSEVIPLGVDATRFHPGAAGASREPFRGGAAHWLLTVCRLVPHKGVDRSLDLLATLRQRGLDVGYVVAGSGPAAEPLARRARELGVADRVRWLGHVPEGELPAVYAAADLYLGLSREEPLEVEGFGLSLLEAAASGLPVIAGSGGGTGESVADGVTGFLVAPEAVAQAADLVERLLRDPGLARGFGAAARARAESRFSWDRVVAALLETGRPGGVPGPGGR